MKNRNSSAPGLNCYEKSGPIHRHYQEIVCQRTVLEKKDYRKTWESLGGMDRCSGKDSQDRRANWKIR